MARRRVALIGATASGKSEVALEVARATHGVEVISVDAMQVYRRMDIGTAKPSAAEREEVAHHCIDLIEPADEFTLADFQRHARRACDDIADRGGLALYVGGTGLYHRAVIDDLDLPGSWPEIRSTLEHEADTEAGLAELYLELCRLDSVAATRMEPTNTRRIVRALEVCRGSGRLFSSFGPGLESYPEPGVHGVIQVGLRWDRAALARRIDTRVAAMIDSGLLEEVRGLAAGPMSRTARQAIGYKELLAHLAGECSLSSAIEAITRASRQFAVRQEKWFRRDPRIRWVDIHGEPRAAVAQVLEALKL